MGKSINKSILSTTGLVSITACTGLVLAGSTVSADDVVDNVSITVPVSCTMSGSGMNTHSAEVPNGTYQANIGTTTINTLCNDNAGFSIYTTGYTGEEIGGTNSNKLVGTSASGNAVIDTGTATGPVGNSDNSNWAMKLSPVTTPTPTYPITITSDTEGTFSDYHTVPNEYTKVATRLAGTDIGIGAEGSSLTTTYAAYISKTQPADTYTGKVKYTLVHPNDVPAPTPPPAPASSCNTPVPGVTYMQDITSSNKATILGNMTQGNAYYLRDKRDEEPYCVSKLAGGNLWMLDNLRLDITDSTILNSLTTTNTNVNEPSLISLKSGNRTAGNQYADGAIAQWDSNNTTNYYNRAAANAESKNTIASTTYGNGSGKIGVYYNYCAASAGSYCYDASAGTGNASYDLCPANWRMPTGDSSGEYNTLYTTGYSSDATNFETALSTPLSGYFYNGSANYQGSYGYFWSSTHNGSSNMYYLRVVPSNVYPTSRNLRHFGYSLRCLLGV